MSFATPLDTQSCHQDFPNLEYSPLGRTNLYVSNAGLGTYRMSYQNSDHLNAAKKSLLAGINLIDTSANYMDGDAEILVGQALRETGVSREKVVIVSKGGYVLKKDLSSDTSYQFISHLDDVMSHCLDPKFIRSQIQQSLARLDLTCIDVYLIHNPEYYLKTLLRDSKENAHDLFYSVIQSLFECLEEEVKKGTIQYYGVSSNHFPYPDFHDEKVDFLRCVSIANSLSDSHHFGVIQFPFNVLESEAATAKVNQRSLLAHAQDASIGVLTNRVFNAYYQDTFIHLKNVLVEREIYSLGEIETCFEDVSNLENMIFNKIIQSQNLEKAQVEQLFNQFSMTGVIHGLMDSKQNYDTFRNALLLYAIPKVEIGLDLLLPYVEESDSHKELLVSFYQMVNKCFEILSSYYKTKKEPIIDQLKTNIFSKVELSPHETLSSMAFSLVRQTVGVDSVLVGMRHTDYVESIVTQCESKKLYQFDDVFWNDLQLMNKNILTDKQKENTI